MRIINASQSKTDIYNLYTQLGTAERLKKHKNKNKIFSSHDSYLLHNLVKIKTDKLKLQFHHILLR